MYTDPTGHSFWSKIGKAVSNTVSQVASAVESTVKTVVNTVTTAVKTTVNTVVQTTKAVVSTVKKVATTCASAAYSAASYYADKAKDVASKVADKIVTTAKEVKKTVSNACKTVANTVVKAATAVGKFCYENKEAILIAGIAIASIALGVVTMGIGTGIGMSMLSGALIGGGIAIGVKEVTDLADNGKIDGTFREYLGAYVGGALAGASAPLISAASGGSIIVEMGLNVFQGSATNAVEQFIATGKVDVQEMLVSGLMEGGSSAAPELLKGANKFFGGAGDVATDSITDAVIRNAGDYTDEAVDAVGDMATRSISDQAGDAATDRAVVAAKNTIADSAGDHLDDAVRASDGVAGDVTGDVAKAGDGAVNDVVPLENGPYIKNGKPNGRPQLSGDAKLEFEKNVYKNNVSPDGILRDPNTKEIINWKPGDPRTNVVDFGHNSGSEYNDVFVKYKNREITLEELKEFQFDYSNYRLETPSANRSHIFEKGGLT
jgi:hypothetical protein